MNKIACALTAVALNISVANAEVAPQSAEARITELENKIELMAEQNAELASIIMTLQHRVLPNITDHGKWVGQMGNLKSVAGKEGPAGKDGKNGVDGQNGKDGINGKDGKDGIDGKDGADGKDGINGKDGADGKDGINGKDGKDGADGKDGVDGKDGKDGKDGVAGKDGKDGKDGTDGKDGVGLIVGIVNNVGSESCVSHGKGTCDAEAESSCVDSIEFSLNRVIGQSKQIFCLSSESAAK